MRTPTNLLISEFVDKEEESQPIMDRFYISKGWEFNRDSACKGWDLILNDTKIEEKFIYNDCGNILIEILQDVISFNRGWYYYTTADRVFFIVTHRELFSVNWPIFKEWLIDEMKQGRKFKPIISVRGYGYTLNLAVMRNEIPTDMYKRFDL